MKCSRCNYESEQAFESCPVCGQPAYAVQINPAAERVLPMLKDNLFLALCVLQSVSVGAALFSGSINVVGILTTIFMWIIFARSRDNTVDAVSMRSVSGCIYANYIIANIAAVMSAVLGVLVGVLFAAFGVNPAFVGALNAAASAGLYDLPFEVTEGMVLLIGWVAAAIIVIVGVITLVFNVFCYKKLHRFAKSMYKSVLAEDRTMIEGAGTARIVLIVLGVFAGISALTALSNFSVMDLLTYGGECAVYIIASVLVKKHIVATEPPILRML